MRALTWVEFGAVKAGVSMEAVLRLYGVDGLKKSGRNQLRGRCPIQRRGGDDAFHASLAKNAFQCFFCGAHGNVLDFVAAMEGCSVRQAALQLQECFAVGGGASESAAGSGEPKLVPEKEGNPPLRLRLRGVDPGHPYLAGRGIAVATARYFGVGFFAGPGLMSGRIVIPIGDASGRTAAYCGRSLDGQAPRYKLPAGFRKSLVLFNLRRAAACGSDRVVVVEGFFDCMKVHQAGLASVVALMGCSLSAEQESLLLDRFDRVILMLDGDAAGRAASRVIRARLSGQCGAAVVSVPEGSQPDQLAPTVIQRPLRSHLEVLQEWSGSFETKWSGSFETR